MSYNCVVERALNTNFAVSLKTIFLFSAAFFSSVIFYQPLFSSRFFRQPLKTLSEQIFNSL